MADGGNPGIERGDHVYARHPRRGAITVRVTAVGKDGFRGQCERGNRYGVPFADYVGHKARMVQNYETVDQGADGAILRGPDGKRRFLAGGVPGVDGLAAGAEPESSPVGPGDDQRENDDPLLGGLGELRKALALLEARPDTFGLPKGSIVFSKALKNAPGLSLQATTDKNGKQVHRWTRSSEEAPRARLKMSHWGPNNSYHAVKIEFRKNAAAGAGHFGIDESGQAFFEGAHYPDHTKIMRAIQRWFRPHGAGVYVRAALRKEDYEYLAAGTHRGSRNHADGTEEGGLSVAHTSEFPSTFCYLVSGNEVGVGSDGEPLLDPKSAKPASKLLRWNEFSKKEIAATERRIAELGLSNEEHRAIIAGHKQVVVASGVLGQGNMDQFHKALAHIEADSTFDNLAKPVLFAKALKNAPGLSLQAITEKGGKQTHRWVRLNKEAPKSDEKGAVDGQNQQNSGKNAGGVDDIVGNKSTVDNPLNHGDKIQFKHGEVVGEGHIVASGKDGVMVRDKAGREQPVRHEHIVKPDGGAAAGQNQGSGAGGDGGGEPPANFSGNSYAEQHNDPSVTAEDIMKAFPPDTAEKMAKVNSDLAGLPQTIDTFKKDGEYTPERTELHRQIANKILTKAAVAGARPAEGEQATFTILGGRGGSGKSWFKNKVYDPNKVIVLDADEIKKMLPEYKGWNAAQVHEESGDIFDRITDNAMTLGVNLVHDSTMKTAKKAISLVNRFKAAGYRTEAHYMYLPPQVAAKRGVERFLGPTNRFVPPGVILGNTTNEATFDQVKNLVDNWSFRDNNVGKGEQPKLISEAQNEADSGKPGLHGQPAAKPEQPGEDVAGGPGDDRRAEGGGETEAPLQKALADGGGVMLPEGKVLFRKAIIPGGASSDLFGGPVHVKTHTTSKGVVVKEHDRKPVARHSQEPSAESKHFYVSAINGPRHHLVAGPYASHDEAKARVDDVFRHADATDGRAHFMAWGTAGSAEPIKTPLGENWSPPAAAPPAPPPAPKAKASPPDGEWYLHHTSKNGVEEHRKVLSRGKPKFGGSGIKMRKIVRYPGHHMEVYSEHGGGPALWNGDDVDQAKAHLDR